MRLWSLAPQYLDRMGLLGCWREALLAQAVLAGRTKGYTKHPQLQRWATCVEPLKAVGLYLAVVASEGQKRGFRLNDQLILQPPPMPLPEVINPVLEVTSGQLRYEMEHLRNKLMKRDGDHWTLVDHLLGEGGVAAASTHPCFKVVSGEIATWEVLKEQVKKKTTRKRKRGTSDGQQEEEVTVKTTEEVVQEGVTTRRRSRRAVRTDTDTEAPAADPAVRVTVRRRSRVSVTVKVTEEGPPVTPPKPKGSARRKQGSKEVTTDTNRPPRKKKGSGSKGATTDTNTVGVEAHVEAAHSTLTAGFSTISIWGNEGGGDPAGRARNGRERLMDMKEVVVKGEGVDGSTEASTETLPQSWDDCTAPGSEDGGIHVVEGQQQPDHASLSGEETRVVLEKRVQALEPYRAIVECLMPALQVQSPDKVLEAYQNVCNAYWAQQTEIATLKQNSEQYFRDSFQLHASMPAYVGARDVAERKAKELEQQLKDAHSSFLAEMGVKEAQHASTVKALEERLTAAEKARISAEFDVSDTNRKLKKTAERLCLIERLLKVTGVESVEALAAAYTSTKKQAEELQAGAAAVLTGTVAASRDALYTLVEGFSSITMPKGKEEVTAAFVLSEHDRTCMQQMRGEQCARLEAGGNGAERLVVLLPANRTIQQSLISLAGMQNQLLRKLAEKLTDANGQIEKHEAAMEEARAYFTRTESKRVQLEKDLDEAKDTTNVLWSYVQGLLAECVVSDLEELNEWVRKRNIRHVNKEEQQSK